MEPSCTNIDIETMEATKAHIAQNPNDGKGEFESVTTWKDGAVAVTQARSFTLETDEPAPLGSTDTAIDPMELLLASLGTCLTIGWVTHANKRGVDFRDLKIKVTAPYDLSGYLDIDKSVRPGFLSLGGGSARGRRQARNRGRDKKGTIRQFRACSPDSLPTLSIFVHRFLGW